MKSNAPIALDQLAAAVQEQFQLEYLVRTDPGEPHVVAELHALLRPRFPQYTASNEYDRQELEVKMLGNSKIIPDLIVAASCVLHRSYETAAESGR